MSYKQVTHTSQAPTPAGAYSQAIKAGNTVYLAGQIGIDPHTGKMAATIEGQFDQVFKNLITVTEAAGGNVEQVVKLTVYLTDLNYFPLLNAAMAKYFHEPYPARTTIQVAALPAGAMVEIDAIVVS